jgi:hypothetical protein
MDEKQFYTSKNIEKYPPDGKLNQCKACITMNIDNWDPETYTWILEELDIPYVKQEWDTMLTKKVQEGKPLTGLSVIGKYISKMKLKQWKDYHWSDSEELQAKYDNDAVMALRAQGYTGDEIELELAKKRTPPRPSEIGTEVDSTSSFV